MSNLDRMLVVKREKNYLSNIAHGRLMFAGTPKVAMRFDNLLEVISAVEDIEDLKGLVVKNDIITFALEDKESFLSKVTLLYEKTKDKEHQKWLFNQRNLLMGYNEN